MRDKPYKKSMLPQLIEGNADFPVSPSRLFLMTSSLPFRFPMGRILLQKNKYMRCGTIVLQLSDYYTEISKIKRDQIKHVCSRRNCFPNTLHCC